jgi:hypothetical protein
LPAALKQKGYLVVPTAFQNNFAVWHYQQPASLKSIRVFDASGRMVWSKQYSGNADRYITIDLTGKSAGTYFVHLDHNNKPTVVEKLVKY